MGHEHIMNNICLVVTGVTRPSAFRVLKNIKETIEAVKSYNVDLFVMTYKSTAAEELISLIENEPDLQVDITLVDMFKDPPGGYSGKNYMMFRMIEMLIEKIPHFNSYDCVVRHRLDCSLESIEIPDKLEDKIFYTVPGTGPQRCFDNICLCKPIEFKNMFNTNTLDVLDAPCPHEAIERAVKLNKYGIKPFNFKKNLYQGREDSVLGVPQWSKRDRTFEYKDKWVRSE